MYKAEILLDSISPSGSRLTTMRVTFPRIILAEMNTHRVFSRNVASSRAISVERRIKEIRNHPFIPLEWGKEQRGMQATSILDVNTISSATTAWYDAVQAAVKHAEILNFLGVHKQIVNRLLEPFCWTTAIISSTQWSNFFNLRRSSLAQPEMKRTADVMFEALDASTPKRLQWLEWHSPLADDPMVAAGRIARVSYDTGSKTDDEDRKLAHLLMQNKHWSPFEHIAYPDAHGSLHDGRNFGLGWVQYRAILDDGVK